MSIKEKYCLGVLRVYSLIVDFDGEPSRKNVPGPVEGETFGRWKERVLGENVEQVVVYAPCSPANQTKIATLQRSTKTKGFERVIKIVERGGKERVVVAVEKAIVNTESRFTNFPRETLLDLIDEMRDGLQPSAVEFLEKYSKENDGDICTEQLLRDLLGAYGRAVTFYRAKNNLT